MSQKARQIQSEKTLPWFFTSSQIRCTTTVSRVALSQNCCKNQRRYCKFAHARRHRKEDSWQTSFLESRDDFFSISTRNDKPTYEIWYPVHKIGTLQCLFTYAGNNSLHRLDIPRSAWVRKVYTSFIFVSREPTSLSRLAWSMIIYQNRSKSIIGRVCDRRTLETELRTVHAACA